MFTEKHAVVKDILNELDVGLPLWALIEKSPWIGNTLAHR